MSTNETDITPVPRRRTARELAERHGISVRTVQRMVGRPRRWWEQHRREIRQKAARLRATGMTWAEVGKALGVSESAARAMGKRATGEWADGGQKRTERDPNTRDLFGSPDHAKRAG